MILLESISICVSLLFIKSKHCVNEEEEQKNIASENGIEITSKSELIRRLEELERYKALGEKLWGMNKLGHENFYKAKSK